MRLEIKDSNGFIRGVWVTKTKHGFNKKQLREQAQIRESIRLEEPYKKSMKKQFPK